METIDNILLVGGSSCIPLVRKMLADKYGNNKVLSSEKPMLAIAEGAAILAQSLPSDEGAITETSIESTENQIGVVLTTKHQTFIQLENPDGSHRMEKIIDSQEVLPFEGNKKFRTVSNNQKIVEIKLFTDAENSSFTKTASGFFTISENLPAMSDLNFTFNLDEDETMTAKVKIGKTGKVAAPNKSNKAPVTKTKFCSLFSFLIFIFHKNKNIFILLLHQVTFPGNQGDSFRIPVQIHQTLGIVFIHFCIIPDFLSDFADLLFGIVTVPETILIKQPDNQNKNTRHK